MSKLRIMSDCHLEFGPLHLDPIGEDVLVLAGDIGVHTEGAEWAREYAYRTGISVVMIAGNHEFYRRGGETHTAASTLVALSRLGEPTTMRPFTFLERRWNTIEGKIFLGTTLWTDYTLDGDAAIGKLIAYGRMNDHRMIHTETGYFKPSDAAQWHDESLRWLTENMTTGAVVITHHLPSRRSIARDHVSDILNPAYASNLDTFVAGSGAALWVHGHTHSSHDYMLGDTRVVCNPRGYWPDGLNPDFDPNLIVEV